MSVEVVGRRFRVSGEDRAWFDFLDCEVIVAISRERRWASRHPSSKPYLPTDLYDRADVRSRLRHEHQAAQDRTPIITYPPRAAARYPTTSLMIAASVGLVTP